MTLARYSRLVAALALSACAFAAQAQPKTRIADLWYAHNAVVTMLGSASDVVATVARPQALPWMFRVAPALAHAQAVVGATVNAEDLLRLNADVVFASAGDPTLGAMRRLGLNVVPVGFDDYDSMLQCIDLTAQTLDTPLARERAHDYRAYLQSTLSETAQAIAAHGAGTTPRVLHVASLAPLKVDGSNTIVDRWMQAAGARNAADGLRGNLKPVSIEQVLAWHPDVVILAANAGSIETTPQRALWQTLDAVRNGHVYRNPTGVFPWDRYGPEAALEVRWAARTLHPEAFAGEPAGSMLAQTQQFYRRFYGYALSSGEAQTMLNGAN
ncbi:ABC transporter substrate-binding protein [Paraburkholderia sp. Ac-20340]|uniref:ABC transporter substrate-binding protein n=1 Tax=Paraburkholderia sp. Ac-20340 TaxID=2703888 RepID=UPI00197F6029|nr:ABC transporter substrate-binding protein [Paraburkholderia sp. Ac-20340]MBN3855840.1 ABC transporter substrate-binding protein [Paraburkholderia sp. Ac-20340]